MAVGEPAAGSPPKQTAYASPTGGESLEKPKPVNTRSFVSFLLVFMLFMLFEVVMVLNVCGK